MFMCCSVAATGAFEHPKKNPEMATKWNYYYCYINYSIVFTNYIEENEMC